MRPTIPFRTPLLPAQGMRRAVLLLSRAQAWHLAHAGVWQPFLPSLRLLVGLAIACAGCSTNSSEADTAATAPVAVSTAVPATDVPAAGAPKPAAGTQRPEVPVLDKPMPPAPSAVAASTGMGRVRLKLDPRITVERFIELHPKATEFFGYDRDFKRYLKDHWNEWVRHEEKMYEELRTFQDMRYDSLRWRRVEHSDDLTELVPETYRQVKSTLKSAFRVGRAAKDGMVLLDLSRRREALLESYSQEKMDWAMGVEILVNSVLYEVYVGPLIKEHKEVRAGRHFRNITDDLLTDTDASRYVTRLRDRMIKLQRDHRDLRATILMNKLMDKQVSYPELAKALERIMASEEPVDVQFDPWIARTFVKDYQSLRLELAKAGDRDRFHIDHWSAPKKKNFQLIVGDIRKRMEAMAKDVNGPYREHHWDPWASTR